MCKIYGSWLHRIDINFFRLPSLTAIYASSENLSARFITGDSVSTSTAIIGADLESDEDLIIPVPDTAVSGAILQTDPVPCIQTGVEQITALDVSLRRSFLTENHQLNYCTSIPKSICNLCKRVNRNSKPIQFSVFAVLSDKSLLQEKEYF